MKNKLVFLLAAVLFFQTAVPAQTQWYQNQDGNNQYPNGTFASCVQPFTGGSFVSCYLWQIENDMLTWKISKSTYNGAETKNFLVSGVSATVEIRAGKRNALYLLKKSYAAGAFLPEFVLYKLDSNLVVLKERIISFPGSFEIFNLNKFILDESDNVYLAGDGQFPANGDYSFASFVSKTDKNLNTNWNRIDTATTSFNGLHVDDNGKVYVAASYYSFFPDVHLYTYSRNGGFISKRIITLSPDRLSTNSIMDDDGNLFFYGVKSADNNTKQEVYLSKYSLRYSVVKYNKTFFQAPGSALIDMKRDGEDNFLMLSAQYYDNGDLKNRISAIHAGMGFLYWQRSFLFANDSCNFSRIATGRTGRFYLLGEKRTYNNNYSKGVAVRLSRHGFFDTRFNGPDSVSFLRSHSLTDGIQDKDGNLISIGNTQDYDTLNYTGTYFRSFAVKFGRRGGDCNDKDNEGPGLNKAMEENAEAATDISVKAFPNPATTNLFVSNIDNSKYKSYAVYDNNGALITRQSFNAQIISLNTSKYTAGMYFLILQSDKNPADNKRVQFAVSK